MPVLEAGVPFSSPEPTLHVENRLRPGTHKFQLVCIDEGGNESDPAAITVTVSRPIIDRDPPVREPIDRFEDIRVREPVIRGGGRVVTPIGRPIGRPTRRGGGQ